MASPPLSAEWSLARLRAIQEEATANGQVGYYQAKARKGEVWHISVPFPDLGIEQNGDILLTPSLPLYLVWEYSGGGLATVYLFENPAVPSARSKSAKTGMGITPRNVNRVIGDDNPPLAAEGFVGTFMGDPGTLLEADVLPGGGNKLSSGGGGSNSSGFILAPGTPYLLRLKNYATEPTSFAVSLRCAAD